MCLGSLQSIGIIDSIAPALDSEMNGIRMAAAFALGQTFHPSAVPLLISALEKDTVKLVKGMLFDALGKTGDVSNLLWLATQKAEFQESEGQAQGILRFALRGLVVPEGNEKMLEIIKEGSSTVGVTYASYHLGRYADSLWLANHAKDLQELYFGERDEMVRSNIIKAIIKARGKEAWPLAEATLKSDADYRVKVNIIQSLSHKSWEKAGKLMYEIACGQDPNQAIAAAESIQRLASESDLRNHIRAAKKTKNWRARALLLGKAMEISTTKKNLPGKIEKRIIALYNGTENVAEKACLLKCLAPDPEKYGFVEAQMKSGPQMVSTYAMETLTLMRKSLNFEKSSDNLILQDIDLDEEFLRIFKTGIRSGDLAIVSMAASVLRDPDLNYKELIKDIGFIEEALKAAGSPEMAEARGELISSMEYFSGKKSGYTAAPAYNHPIDWERVMNIPPKQLVEFVTSKGEIVVQLNVNWCPGTVSAFLELVESGFYNNGVIHRVVPNFVVQDGCPRGDGWGGPPFTLRSEFTPAPFMEGTLGMASAGKDTEGSQWYFTHSATPHLDGKYTNFGFVVSGIEIVHQLEVGDVIEKVEVIRESEAR